MGIKIGHASIDENGNIIGGKAGDQSTNEICIRSWYRKPWNVYLECKDPVLADKAAIIMEQICTDNNFGYDQSERLSGYNSIVKNGSKIRGAKGEFDCSSLVSACYKLSGLDISVSNTTGSIRTSFLATGKFEAYFDDDHLNSDKFAKRGGVFLKERSHVVMALENGSGKIKNPYNEPTRTISKGCEGGDVKWVQWELCNAGFVVEVDGKCGLITDTRIKEYQRKHKLNVDGKVGPITRNSMKAI